LAGRTPEQALDAHIERARTAIACLVDAVVFGSGNAQNDSHSLTLYAAGQNRPNQVRLPTHSGDAGADDACLVPMFGPRRQYAEAIRLPHSGVGQR
jgi:hypothetical protein